MSFDQFVTSIGLGDILTDGVFVAEVGMLSLSAVLFLSTLIMCLLAYRASVSARRARAEAQGALQSAHDAADEVRRLRAEAERAAHSAREYSEALAEEMRAGQPSLDAANEDRSASDEEISLGAEDEVRPADKSASRLKDELEKAKGASALLRGLLRPR